jgi:hypothetical protein
MLIDLLGVVRDEFLDVALGESDLGEDLVGGRGPLERSRFGVPGGDIGADGLDEDLHGGEGAAPDGLAGDDAEPGLDLVQPAGAGRGEVEMDVRVRVQPGPDVGVVWVDRLSSTTWISRRGYGATAFFRKDRNAGPLRDGTQSPITSPCSR